MDPYLEAHWADVHASLLVYAANQLNTQLPDDLVARIEEAPIIEDEDSEDEPRTQRHLRIIESRYGGRVVTAIEVISLYDKVGRGGPAAYTHRQREYFETGANLIEVDLIRQGTFVLAVQEDRIPSACRTPYLICVHRAASPQRSEVYAVSLRDSLPNFAVPLRPSDTDVVLQLQPLLDDCYRDGRYHRIDYRAEPVPRLGEADALWADQILREKGLR